MSRILSFQPSPTAGIVTSAFTIIQPITGTSPTASGSSTLTFTSASGIFSIAGTASTKTIDFALKTGGTITGGIANAILFLNGSSQLSVDLNFTYAGGSLYVPGTASVVGGYVVLDVSTYFDNGAIFTDGFGTLTVVDLEASSAGIGVLSTINLSCSTIKNSSSAKVIDVDNQIIYDSGGGVIFGWNSLGIACTAKFTSYRGDTTAGNGIISIVGNVDLSNQASTIADTTIFTPSAAGMYRLSAYVETTTAGSAGTLAVQIKYSDDNGAQAVDPLPVSNISLAATGFSQGSIVIRSGSATAIKYNTTVAAAVGSPKYALKIVLERLS